MIWVAFTLGFMGSLHCIGMCGPIAIPLARVSSDNRVSQLIHITKYNSGRVITYSILGLIFGMISELINFSGLQSSLSILGGIFLIGLFAASLDIEKFLFRWPAFKRLFSAIQNQLSKVLTGSASKYPLLIGLVNGILPCGLVYLALAGAVTSGSAVNGMLFMLFFGLGTFPSMVSLMLGIKLIDQKFKSGFNRIFPVLHLLFGILLIIRGLSASCHM